MRVSTVYCSLNWFIESLRYVFWRLSSCLKFSSFLVIIRSVSSLNSSISLNILLIERSVFFDTSYIESSIRCKRCSNLTELVVLSSITVPIKLSIYCFETSIAYSFALLICDGIDVFTATFKS